MQVPSYGAAPLSSTFLVVRVMEIISMIIIIGMTANFVNAITSGGIEPPQEIVGALVIVSSQKRWNITYTSILTNPIRLVWQLSTAL